MQLTEIYQNQLDNVRRDLDLLNNYKFDKDSNQSNHFDRLRLNITIYNDLKPSDYEIVKFLFIEETKWRRDAKDGEVDNLYFSAFVLTLFNNPEIIWLFWNSKNIDFDSSIGFDGQYLVSAGIQLTYEYLETVENTDKKEVLSYIGQEIEHCVFSQEEIDEWKESRKSYFRIYQFPVINELDFLFSTNEKDLFLKKLPEWIKQDRQWTYQELGQFKSFAKYSGDKHLEIEALILALEKNENQFLKEIYKRELAELYIDINEKKLAVDILNAIIKNTDNENIVRDCLEQLCRIILLNKEKSSDVSKASFEIIKKQQKKYRHFSPRVDNMITDARQIMGA